MNKRLRGVVYDLDGIAVPSGAPTVESEALLRVSAELPRRVVTLVATGRTIELAMPILRQLNIRRRSVVANGAQIIDSQTGDIKWQRLLSEQQVGQVIGVCALFQNAFSLDGGNELGLAADQQARPVAGAHLMGLSVEDATKAYERLAEVKDIRFYSAASWFDPVNALDVHIGHEQAHKQKALEVLFDMYNVTGAELIAVGDGINDMELFEAVGPKNRIAVANAHPQLLDQAYEVVASQAEDGLASVLGRFIQVVPV